MHFFARVGVRIATGALRPRNDTGFYKGCGTSPAGGQGRPPLHTVCRKDFVGGGVLDAPVAPAFMLCVGRRALTPPGGAVGGGLWSARPYNVGPLA